MRIMGGGVSYCSSFIRWPLIAGFSIILTQNTVPVEAATDGTLGALSSSGTNDLTLGINDLVKISGVGGLAFGNYDGSGAVSLDDDVCIYNNNSGGQYKVTAKGDGAGLAFTVNDGSTHTIAYTVKFNNTSGTGGNFPLTSNSTSSALTGANTTSQSCGGGSNANFEVTFTQSALMSKPAGTYSGVLTLVIEPA